MGMYWIYDYISFYNIPERLGSEEMSLVALELRFFFFFTLPELLGENFFISCLLASGFAENSECFNFPYWLWIVREV